MIKGIEHVGIAAKDTAALTKWYVDVLECRVVYENPASGTYFVAFGDNSMIEIYASDVDVDNALYQNKGQGIRHISVEVEDFEASVKKLTDMGIEAIQPIVNAPKASTFFFRDPEGNIVHFICRDKPLI